MKGSASRRELFVDWRDGSAANYCRQNLFKSGFPFNRLLPFGLLLPLVATHTITEPSLQKSDSLQVQFLLGAAGIGLIPVRLRSLDQ